MNNRELEKLLQVATPPARPGEYWEEFPQRVSAAIQAKARRGVATSLEVRPWWTTWTWGFSAATACLLLAFGLGLWRGPKQSDDLLRNEKLLREVLTMFPNQVRAIIQDENGLHVSLTDKADMPDSPPLWIKICDGERCRSFVTFSGQSLQIAGQRVEALADARGGVLLVGERFVWSNKEPTSPGHLRIRAEPLKEPL